MPIAARSAPNNGRVKEAKVSSCTRGTGKTVNGEAKRGDKMDIDRRTNGDKRGDIDKATIGKVKKGNNKDKNIGRGENKSKNVRGNGKEERVDWGSTARPTFLSLFSFLFLFTFLFLLSLQSSSLFPYIPTLASSLRELPRLSTILLALSLVRMV